MQFLTNLARVFALYITPNIKYITPHPNSIFLSRSIILILYYIQILLVQLDHSGFFTRLKYNYSYFGFLLKAMPIYGI